MKTKFSFILYLICYSFFILLTSCSTDDSLEEDPFVVAFKNLSINLSQITEEESITLVYSQNALENGNFTVSIDASNAIYGKDFITIPAAENNNIQLTIEEGQLENNIVFKKLNTLLDETTVITFTIASINYSNSNIQGNTDFLINSSPSLGGSILPEVGGPNQQNQVFIDLSNQNVTIKKRDSWDLGFYGGSNQRVAINGSLYMAAKALEATDIDSVNETDVIDLQREVAVGTFNEANQAYIDAPNGNILETAIDQISIHDDENPVYLLNLGYEVGTAIPNAGSVAVAGNQRGWKKIKILWDGENYKLQYADLNATTHKEILIQKDANYNYKHFSFNTDALVTIEPQKEKWDICFTVFTNIIEGAGSYGFSDFVVHNTKGNVAAYEINTNDFSYDDFSITDVNNTSFSIDQTSIGSNWRDVFSGGSVYADRFYVIKDANNNIYKLKFLAITNNDGERGHPEFEYELLL
ncbi:hypothetical protein GCM10022393_33000 [Aquimarina addita]|uniref:HmuY protein n=1 Tax=Aquimarina addita TaxID=870485 RepID=A0ABP6US96_9FLAO